MKENCWEFKNCGRQPGGAKSKELGVCPATIEVRTDGINQGENGGRVCWAIAGTLCGGKVQGVFATKFADCLECEFYARVRDEEGANYVATQEILKKLK